MRRRIIPHVGQLLRAIAAAGVTLATAVATATPIAAQAAGDVDSLVRAFRDAQSLPGVVVAVVRPEGERFVALGHASLDGGAPVTADTRFEIGSVTKALTALLLAEMAGRGEVRLDDPIGRHLPDQVRAPTHGDAPIELWHLATHTSALPRLPGNMQPANMADPYADYDAERLHAFLDSCTLTRAPGERYDYSNLGAGLLGHLLAHRADTSYAALLERRILAPLGMTSSYVPVPGDDDTLMARGHMGARAVPYWHLDALAGAGALRSSARDLARLVRAQLDPTSTPIAAAIEASHAIRHDAAQQPRLALGWHVTPGADGSQLYWHNGGTGGFRSFVGFVPGGDVGVVVLANAAIPVDAITLFGMALTRAALESAAPGSEAPAGEP